MFNKKVAIVACALILVLGILFFGDNMLVWDDMSYTYNENQIYAEEMPAPQPSATPEGTNTPTSPSELNSLNTPSVKKGYHIHINLNEHMLYVYKDGQLLKAYPCSGGKASTPTPLGTWRIIGKDTWGEGFGGAWMAFNVPWGKYGIHGTIYPWLIGKSNASKGCIRMLNKDVKELYKIVPHGTTVTIIDNNPIFRTLRAGAVGSDVQKLQKALSKLGYYRGSADGRFGTGLKASVIKFQKDNKMKPTGIADKRTFNLIISKADAIEAQN